VELDAEELDLLGECLDDLVERPDFSGVRVLQVVNAGRVERVDASLLCRGGSASEH
jgi:hypothetical protein